MIDINQVTKIAHQASQKKELYYLLSGKAHRTLGDEKPKPIKWFLLDEAFILNCDQYYLHDIYVSKGKLLVIRMSTLLRLKQHHLTQYLELLKLIHLHHNLRKLAYSQNVIGSYEL